MSLRKAMWRGGLWGSQFYPNGNGPWRGGLWASQRAGGGGGGDSPSTLLAVGGISGDYLAVYSADDYSQVAGAPAESSNVNAVAFSHDRAWMAIAKNSTTKGLRVFNTSDWSEITISASIASGNGEDVSFSPDDGYLVYSGGNRTIVIDTSDWTTVVLNVDMVGSDQSCDWSGDGTMLALGFSSGNLLRIYNTTDWTFVEPSGVTQSVTVVKFSHNSSRLGTGGGSGEVLVFDTSDWSTLLSSAVANLVGGIAWPPDDSQMAVSHVSGDGLSIFDSASWTVLTGTPVLPSHGRGCDYNAAGTQLAVGYQASPYLAVYSLADWSQVAGTPSVPERAYAVTYN